MEVWRERGKGEGCKGWRVLETTTERRSCRDIFLFVHGFFVSFIKKCFIGEIP